MSLDEIEAQIRDEHRKQSKLRRALAKCHQERDRISRELTASTVLLQNLDDRFRAALDNDEPDVEQFAQ